MTPDARIFVAGGDSFVGAAIVKALERRGYRNVVTGIDDKLDLTDAERVDTFIARERPQYVFCVAGRTGGIDANRRYPADLMLDRAIPHEYRDGPRRLRS